MPDNEPRETPTAFMVTQVAVMFLAAVACAAGYIDLPMTLLIIGATGFAHLLFGFRDPVRANREDADR